MIQSWKHRGLKRFWDKGDLRRINPDHRARLERMLAALDKAKRASDMDVPGFHFHAVPSKGKGTYSVRVSGNWRLTFRFDGADAIDVNYVDYH